MARNRFSGLLPTEMTLFDGDDALFREIRRLPVERFRLFPVFDVLTVLRAPGRQIAAAHIHVASNRVNPAVEHRCAGGDRGVAAITFGT